jgi:tRNA threonylcarbamoyladenosine biosynthesis protein TsaB
MRILALETSSTLGTIAAADGGRLVAEHALDPQVRSARSLAPGIQQLLTDIGWRPKDLEILAVTIGPGSFTGLRVGIATAKTLAYSLQARCVGLTTLEVIAAQYGGTAARLSVVIDAQRGQVFAASFCRREQRWQIDGEPTLLNADDWLASLNLGAAVSGPALAQLASRLPAGMVVADADLWTPRAATVAALAWQRHLDGKYDDLWKLAPLYLRKSAAEEKLDDGRANRGLAPGG